MLKGSVSSKSKSSISSLSFVISAYYLTILFSSWEASCNITSSFKAFLNSSAVGILLISLFIAKYKKQLKFLQSENC